MGLKLQFGEAIAPVARVRQPILGYVYPSEKGAMSLEVSKISKVPVGDKEYEDRPTPKCEHCGFGAGTRFFLWPTKAGGKAAFTVFASEDAKPKEEKA
jgi:hypothetical protein